ncbi:hypothetical protein [Halobellus sp. GM3]|uniref:hypothetical protein n=1 Tax=Halobellus sp. GM3 TaxID=3458410 RepID=UPI00403D69A8
MTRQSTLEQAAEAADDLPDAEDIVAPDEEVPIRDVFDAEFMGSNTDFDTLDEMVAASPSTATSADDLERVGSNEWDEFVAETTVFPNEEAFVFAARDHWVAKSLGLN